MAGSRIDTVLALACDLDARDADVAGRLGAVDRLAARAAALTARAVEISRALEGIPAELGQVEQREGEARLRDESASHDLEAAEARVQELEQRRRAAAEDRDAAARAVARARQDLADATAWVERVTARRVALGERERTLRAEADGLAVEARTVAAAIRETPGVSESGRDGPGASLEQLVAWGARVRAALFVARNTLVSERDRIVTEANALATATLGEQLAGASVTLVRRRLEQALGA